MLTLAAKIFGFVFLVIGILGFIPGLTPDHKLLGIFEVNTLHNLIHLGSGIAALWTGYTSSRAARTYFQVFGVVYGLVTVSGLLYGDDEILGLVAHNMADFGLHLIISVAALILGFGSRGKEMSET